MVEIQCPNCDVVVEFEDGVPGVFSCHNCQSNIEWGYTVKTTKRTPGGTIFFWDIEHPWLDCLQLCIGG